MQHDQMAEMKGVISRLEKTLMSENRLKVDLFRALNESKTQIETLTSKICVNCLPLPRVLADQLRNMELERIQNGFAPSLKSDFMSAQLPSSLLASLAMKGFDENSTNSSSPTTVSPSSTSPSLVAGLGQQGGGSKMSNGSGPVLGINPQDVGDLERLLRGNGTLYAPS